MLQRSIGSSWNREVREGLCTNLQSLMSHSRFGWPSPFFTELSWNCDGPLHPTSRYTEARVPLREKTNVHEEFRSSSSAPFGKQFGRSVWPQPCSKVVEGQIRGSRLRCSCAGWHPSAGSFFLPHHTADRTQHSRVFSHAFVARVALHCPRTLRQVVVS